MNATTKLALAAALAAGLVQSAAAADLPRRTDPYVAPVYSAPAAWQGFYAGVHLGGGFGSTGAVDTSGFVGGLQGGYNFQFDRVVVGAEADLTLSDVGNSGFTEKARHDWLATLRGRAGYTFGNILAYGTLGFAFADSSYRNVFGVTDDTSSGWTIGGGAEMLFTPNIAVRAEYLRYQLSSQSVPSPVGIMKVDSNVNVIRAGVNYKF